MQSWVVDAGGFRIEDVNEFKEKLLEKTGRVRNILNSSNRELVAVAAPKGFGKTLLLMLKRLEFKDTGVRLLPRDSALVDKAARPAPTLSESQVKFIQARPDFWSFLWSLSFAVAAIKAEELSSPGDQPSRIRSPLLRAVMTEKSIQNASDVFKRLLKVEPAEHAALISDYDELIPMLRNIQMPTYLFLDNIDEFCARYLPEPDTPHSSSGEYDRRFWYDAQTGAIKAARNITALNQHVRVYCTIRKEALDLLSRTDPESNQIQGACVVLSYTRADLQSILQLNIENDKSFASPDVEDVFERWVGPESAYLQHGTTGELEHLPDYIVRHTLGRPRDVASIGRCIADLKPIERTPPAIKNAVNTAASEIVRSYIAECRPHVPFLNPDLLFPLTFGNVLSRDELERVGEAYVQMMRRNGFPDELDWRKVFSSLFRMGLLGYVGKVAALGTADIQIFLEAGTRSLIGPELLPDAEYYLIHPALSDYISADYQPRYLRNANKMNIVGYNRVWRNSNDGYFVLIGDVVNSSEFSGKETERVFVEHFSQSVSSECRDLLHKAVSNGDRVVLADQNPTKLLQRASALARRMKCSEYGKAMRFGGDYGVLGFASRAGSKLPFGAAFRRASRIEPVSDPDTLFVTDEFFQRCAKASSQFSFVYVGERNISKPSEPIEHHVLWRLSILPD